MQDFGNKIAAVNLFKAYTETKPKELLICSYTLGLGYLEQKLLTKLKKSFDTKITIVSSSTGLAESSYEAFSLSGVGTEYYLYQVNDKPYAFHPKIFAVIGQHNDFFLYVGGANFTYSGMCLNMDAVEKNNHGEMGTSTRENLRTFWDELERQVNASQFTNNLLKFRSCLENVTINSNPPVTFLHNFKDSIAHQLAEQTEKIQKIKIISPYYDQNMGALKSFAEMFGNPDIELLCNKDDEKVNLEEIPGHYNIYYSEQPEEQSKRFMHAKVYLLYAKNTIYACTGSANCTWPGLMSSAKDGNWETCVLRKNVSREYAETLWRIYYPKKLIKKNYWKFIAPKKKPEKDIGVLYFSAVINYDVVTITPVDKFPETILKASAKILIKDGEDVEIELHHLGNNSEFNFYIDPEVKDLIGDDPFRVEISIESPVVKKGWAWVMQMHNLKKSAKIRKLEQAINQLQNNNPDGWNQALEIIDFISSNLPYLSVNRPSGEKRVKAKKDKAGSFQVPTIAGIRSVDEKINIFEGEISLYDMIDMGSAIKKIIEKGFTDIDTDEDNNEENGDSVPASAEPDDKKAKRSKTIDESQEDDRAESRKQEIIDQIPDLSSIFAKKVGPIFDECLRSSNEDIKKEGMSRFEALLNMIAFCLKFIRFIRLEMATQSKFSDSFTNIQKYINEIAPILIWFWEKYPTMKETFGFDTDYLKEALSVNELLPEMTNCLIEFWYLNLEQRLANKKVFFCAVEELNNLFGMETIKNNMHVFLESSGRFNSERNNLLFNVEELDTMLLNITRYKEKQKDLGEKYKKHIKFLYWEQAQKYHTIALERYDRPYVTGRDKYEEHEKRKKIASFMMDKCLADGKDDLGKHFNPKIYDKNRVVGISELKNKLQYALCPKCGHEFNIEVFTGLKQYKTIECPRCEVIVIPEDKYEQYVFKRAQDKEWAMDI